MKTYDELKSMIDQRGVHEVFGAPGEGWGIEQNAEELARFLVHMQALGVTSILEIGTGWRAGLARFLHNDMGWAVTSVDVQNYGHQFGGIQFVRLGDNVSAEYFAQYDLVLIDASHTYDDVKHDAGMWRPNAEKVVAFHDIAGLRDCEGVAKYWTELAGKGDRTAIDHYGDGAAWFVKPGYYEMIAHSDQRGGIGYIVLAEVEAPKTVAEAIATRDKQAYVDAQNEAKEAAKPPAKKPAPRKPAAKKPAAKTTTPNKKPAVKK